MYKRIFILLILTGFCCFAWAQNPQWTYFSNVENPEKNVKGAFRVLSIKGRKGINTQSIHSQIKLDQHTLHKTKGSVTMWVASLEDLSPVPKFGDMDLHNKEHRTYPILSFNQNPQERHGTPFKWFYTPYWHGSFRVMWVDGTYYWDTFEPDHIGATLVGNEFHFEKYQWYQLTLTWNYETDDYRLYANGILIGTEPHYVEKPFRKTELSADSMLYTGNPQLCYSSIVFYDEALTQEKVAEMYASEATDFNDEVQEELLRLHTGTGKKAFDFSLNHQWEEKLSLSLQEREHLDYFYVQGYGDESRITKEGLRIITPFEMIDQTNYTDQVYFWTWKTFEGDIYIEYDFKINHRGGLSLLIFNASGMNREDFMKDYKLRTTGKMRMVAWEDVRNYHWEYYRDQIDVRNDVSSSAMLKNPFQRPMDYNTLGKKLESDVWHKLQLVKRGNHIVGGINGVVMIDAVDNGFENDGPVFDYGHLAIRCMINSDVTFRNLKVYNRNEAFEVVKEYRSKK